MQRIIPHLWFEKNPKEAVVFYVSLFGKQSKINNTVTIPNTPSGDCTLVDFELRGYKMQAIGAGPFYKFNPSVSFMLNFNPASDHYAIEELDAIWNALAQGGSILMPLGEYPFSKRYGFVQDKFGVFWQLYLTNIDSEQRPFIIPSLIFAGNMSGKAEEASDFYISIFKNSKRTFITRYSEPNQAGNLMYSEFLLDGQLFVAMDGPLNRDSTFEQAISFIVLCYSQDEIDYFWEKLSDFPENGVCGWLKDKYGFPWQIVPSLLVEMLCNGTPEQIASVTRAFLQMKKFEISILKEAFQNPFIK